MTRKVRRRRSNEQRLDLLHVGVSAGYLRRMRYRFGEFESTEWSVVFDQSALTATYYHRENYETGYFFPLFSAR